MSNYFRTLLRLEKRTEADQSGRLPDRHDSEGHASDDHRLDRHDLDRHDLDSYEATHPSSGSEPQQLGPIDLVSFKKQNAHAALLDALRAVSARGQTPSIVVAGIARHRPVGAVIDGIASQAAVRGVGVQIGDVVVSASHRILSTREGTPEPRGLDGPPERTPGQTTLSLELSAPATQEALKKWFASAGAGYDLLIVAAPSLLSSVDAALVARACDGLVLVAEPLVTLRDEFEIAVERARSSGCHVLGLVMNDYHDFLPRFLQRLFGAYPRSILPSDPKPK